MAIFVGILTTTGPDEPDFAAPARGQTGPSELIVVAPFGGICPPRGL